MLWRLINYRIIINTILLLLGQQSVLCGTSYRPGESLQLGWLAVSCAH